MRIWFSFDESRVDDFGVVRQERPAHGHVLLALSLVFAATTIIGCTRSSLNSASPSTTKCQVSAKTGSGSIAASGGTAEVDVTTEPECAWKATTDTTWVAELTPASGQGPAKVEVRAAANADPAPRRGTVQIGGVDVQIAQDAAPCTFVVAPLTRTVSASGGTSTITVTANSACAWTASSTVPWITIQSGATASGNGVATIAVAPCTGTSRTGTVVISGQNVSISQDASKCGYSVAPNTFD